MSERNEDIDCRLRIQGAWGMLCGVHQLCLMLGKKMNISFPDQSDSDFFDCHHCPNPQKRKELLAFYKEAPDCQECSPPSRNMALKEIKRGSRSVKVCHSCFAYY